MLVSAVCQCELAVGVCLSPLAEPPSHLLLHSARLGCIFVSGVACFWILWEGTLKYVLFFVSIFFFLAAHYVFEIHLMLWVTCGMYHVILMSIPPFIHSVVGGHLDCFQLWFMTSNTALTVFCSVCVWVYGGIKWSGVLGLLGMHMFNFSRYCQMKFQSRPTGCRILWQFQWFLFLTQARLIRAFFSFYDGCDGFILYFQ